MEGRALELYLAGEIFCSTVQLVTDLRFHCSEKLDILAYFPKMKLCFSNHQSVCPPLITFEPLGRFS
jgi:hypothetical protein